jgi:anti-sigma factor RsiW
MRRAMFSCDDLRAELSHILDDDVSPDLRERIRHHLSECRLCTVLVDSTRKTITILTDSGSFDLPDTLSDRLTAMIMEKVRDDGKK